jgi:hypothetical protein
MAATVELAWQTSWLEVGITGHIFGRGPSKDHSTKVWLQLVQWFMRRRFVCEFPIGFYVKLSSRLPTKMSAKLKIEKGEMKFRKIFSETTEPISTKLC